MSFYLQKRGGNAIEQKSWKGPNLLGDGIVTGSLTAIILNLFFNLSLKENPTVNNTLKTTIE
ncbi:hypothetical protein QT237_11150 [Geobacillus stearothermophilus]|nr:hypothetical protein QT237_11150 [Geobacillus stearothermophilus]